MKRMVLVAVAALGLACAQARADHDRPPTDEERARIEQALDKMGYKSHGEIEIEGRKVEVDDAVDAKGQRWDLKLDAKTLKLIHREREHD
jgi:opacity protein-like surface antigen